jgi:hypothetical protein
MRDHNGIAAGFHVAGNHVAETALIRTSMCKVKNHLFERAAVFGLPAPTQTGIWFLENDFLPQAELVVARAQRRPATAHGR